MRPATPTRPSPTPVAASPAAAGNWRIQLGAFSNRGNAQALWTRLAPRLPGAAPSYTAAAALTRLLAGPYTSRTAAQAACARIAPQACIPVGR